MDIATAANFPCQRPFSEHLGVAELPDYRIHARPQADRRRRRTCGRPSKSGGPFLFTQALMWTSTDPDAICSGDWYRDWGQIERYHRLVPATTWRRSPPSSRASTTRVRLEPTRTDSSTAVSTQIEHPRPRARDNVKVTRWVATIAGLIGFLLSVATPLLPVVQTTADAELAAERPAEKRDGAADLADAGRLSTATVPCDVVRGRCRRPAAWCSAPHREKARTPTSKRCSSSSTSKRVDVTDRNVVILSGAARPGGVAAAM